MAANTVEFTLRLDAAAFNAAVKQAGDKVRELPSTARESSRGLNRAFEVMGMRPFRDIQREIRLAAPAFFRAHKFLGFSRPWFAAPTAV